ncbi:MAG: hypothetical protein JSR46_10390, partial [Verrucomicrobia bacterium]|nr:hypothetical protein [Verrucomicrobiota bacterium]
AHVKKLSIEIARVFCRFRTCIKQLRDSLEELYIRDTEIDDSDIAALAVLKKLKKLEIRQCKRVTGATFHLLPDSLTIRTWP